MNDVLTKGECSIQTLFVHGVLTKTHDVIEKRPSLYNIRLGRGISYNLITTKLFCKKFALHFFVTQGIVQNFICSI